MRKPIYYRGEMLNYSVDEYGNVFNDKTAKQLSPWKDYGGYLHVNIRDNPTMDEPHFRDFQVHRLVAQAFIPNPDNNPQVNHIDGNPQNNNRTNLEWVINKENYDHARRIGLIKTGGDLPYASITNETAHKICKMMEDGFSNLEIIEAVSLKNDTHGKALVTSIRTGRNWKDVSAQYDFEKKGTLRKNSIEMIHTICQKLQNGKSTGEIYEIIGTQFDIPYKRAKSLIGDIRTRKSWKDISKDYTF